MSSEVDECITTVSYGDDGHLSRYESFETESERKSSDECNENQGKSINENRDIFGSSAINSYVSVPQFEDTTFPMQDEGLQGEDYLNFVLHKLSQDMVRIQKELWVEKDMVEEELASYKEIQAILSNINRKDIDVKYDPFMPLRERIKHSKQCARRLIPNRTPRDSIPLMTPMMDPWFFKKTLRDAEKLCEIELERVRKCISVFSITPHTAESSSRSLTDRGSGLLHLSPIVHPGSSKERSNYSHVKHKNTLEISESVRFSETLELESPKVCQNENKCEQFNTPHVDEWSSSSNLSTIISCNGDSKRLPSATSHKSDLKDIFPNK